jgi:two-component system, NtrC family, sensor kinase
MELRDFQRETARLLVNFRALADLSAEIASAHDFSTTVRSCLLMVLGALSATRGALLMLNRATSRLELCVARGVQIDVEVDLPLSEADSEALIGCGSAFSLEEPLAALRALASEVSHHLPGMLVAAPLVVREQMLGMIAIGPKLTRQPYSEGELELFSMLAMMLASGIYSHRLIQGLQEANQALRDTQEQLIRTEKLATIGQLATGIAHEVKNPLTAILGFAGTLQTSAAHLSAAEVREYAGIIVDESRRLQSIIDEVRQYSKPKGYMMEPLPLVEVVEETLSFTRFDTLLRQIEIRREYRAHPVVRLNRDKIKQVLLNLLRNAAQAMRSPNQGLIRVVVDEEGEFGAVRIIDNGSGMPPETLARIFQPFFTTRGDEGTGLGLDICRQIIEQGHGGEIWAESEVGVGTTFTLRLPLATAAAALTPPVTEGAP